MHPIFPIVCRTWDFLNLSSFRWNLQIFCTENICFFVSILFFRLSGLHLSLWCVVVAIVPVSRFHSNSSTQALSSLPRSCYFSWSPVIIIVLYSSHLHANNGQIETFRLMLCADFFASSFPLYIALCNKSLSEEVSRTLKNRLKWNYTELLWLLLILWPLWYWLELGQLLRNPFLEHVWEINQKSSRFREISMQQRTFRNQPEIFVWSLKRGVPSDKKSLMKYFDYETIWLIRFSRYHRIWPWKTLTPERDVFGT